MAVTYSATPIKKFRSSIINALISAAAGADETVTLIHRLTDSKGAPATPHEIKVVLRSLTTMISGTPIVRIMAYTASNATIFVGMQGSAGALVANYDFIAEYKTAQNN